MRALCFWESSEALRFKVPRSPLALMAYDGVNGPEVL